MVHFEFVRRGQIAVPRLITSDTRRVRWVRRRRVVQDALVAHVSGKVVGVLTFAVAGRVLDLRVAWVHPRRRRGGLAKRLLRLVVDETRPRVVSAEVITRRGLAFVAWAQGAFPRVQFVVDAGRLK